MKYEDLSHNDFDAIVTGELTQYALNLEGELIDIITNYFVTSVKKRADFKRLVLYREGLTFQDKIEIVRAMIPIFEQKPSDENIKSLLKQVENFKSWRNALSHGNDVSEDKEKNELKIQTVNRAGKEKVVNITPKSHQAKLAEAEKLLSELEAVRKSLK